MFIVRVYVNEGWAGWPVAYATYARALKEARTIILDTKHEQYEEVEIRHDHKRIAHMMRP